MEECIAIIMPCHNDCLTISDAINSVLKQKRLKRELKLVISLDASTDNTHDIINTFLPDDRIILFHNNFTNVSKNRNFLLDYCRTGIAGCVLIGRLDADDVLSDDTVLSEVEKRFDETGFDVLICGNYQQKNGEVLKEPNFALPELLNSEYLLNRLLEMSNGISKAELPSCNTFINPGVKIMYPENKSGEDHWLLVELLLRSDELNIRIASDLIYCIYSLGGSVTNNYIDKGEYLKSRKQLYEYAKCEFEKASRKKLALNVLNTYKINGYNYLGSGFSGVVFHDNEFVYKVHIPIASNNYNEIDHILYLKQKMDLFVNRKHFYKLTALDQVDGVYILVYPYEISEKADLLTKDDMISFLTEMWSMKIICRSITKQNNFVRVNGVIKLIDYEIEPYSDNLFLNVIARAFIQLSEFEFKSINYDKIKRTLINNLDLPELNGLWEFCYEIFRNIALKDISNILLSQPRQLIKEKKVYDGKILPKVDLLIKSCIQDSKNLFGCVSHIVSQLPKAVQFNQRVLLLDTYKGKQFLRQYSKEGSVDELRFVANELLKKGLVDKIFEAPHELNEIQRINLKWLGSDSLHTHTFDQIPVTSQLYAFDSLDCDYIFQMDCDVLIGCRDTMHDFLSKTLELFSLKQTIVTAGFQICQNPEMKFQPYIGFDGKVAVDPRCSIIHKQRLENILPIANKSLQDGWSKSWYRGLQLTLSEKGFCSVRGGDTSTYYVHPQNFKKASSKVWSVLKQQIERNLIPVCQYGEPEINGNIFEWTIPKRNESLVVVIYFNEFNLQEWIETVESVLSQDYRDVGIVLLINTLLTDKDRSALLNYTCHISNCTLIEFEQVVPYNEAVYDAIHYYMQNDKSFICLIKQGDLILGNTVFSDITNRLKLYDSDVLIGKEISQRHFNKAGISSVNFINPRVNNAHTDNGLQVFTRQLFDSLSYYDLKKKKAGTLKLPGVLKLKHQYSWIDDPEGHTIMAPVIELSKNPIRFDHFNVLRKRTLMNAERRNDIFSELQSKNVRKESDVIDGRKVFRPNLNKIELDITYDCNLKCKDCNRSCSQAPDKSKMSIEQIKSFIKESIETEKKWELINILGGEPTLHPYFNTIVEMLLYDYVEIYSPKTIIQITSNGYGAFVKEKLKKIPEHDNLIIDEWSFKQSLKVPYFTSFNNAPRDNVEFKNADFKKACWVTSYCGIGLNHLGYFPCSIAGAMERVMSTHFAIKNLKDVSENMDDLFMYFCSYCGNFMEYAANKGDFMERAEKNQNKDEIVSNSWLEIYDNWNVLNNSNLND